MYDYRVVEVLRVVDGDTVDLRLDLGFYLSAALRFRLLGIDAPELRGAAAERERARQATDYARTWLAAALARHDLRAVTYRSDHFGRWLADLIDGTNGASLADALVAGGLATR